MVRLSLLKKSFGFIFQGVGFFWALFDRVLCKKIANSCTETGCSNSNCYLLFLFVSIIFIICGYTLITMKPHQKKKLKKSIKKGFKKISFKFN